MSIFSTLNFLQDCRSCAYDESSGLIRMIVNDPREARKREVMKFK